MEPFNYFILILLSTLFLSILAGTEMALVSVWKLRLEIDLNQNSILSKLKTAIRKNPEKYVASLLIVNLIVTVLCVIAFAGLLIPHFEKFISAKSITFFLTVFVSAGVIFMFKKLIPKIVFPFIPVFLNNLFILSLSFFSFLFYPITRILLSISNSCIKQEKEASQGKHRLNPLFNRIEMNWFADSHHLKEPGFKESSETEVKLFRNALDFSKVKLREIMVPRTEIAALDLNASMEELRQKFVETGFSRIVFYDENVDNIQGYVHSSVIFKNTDSFKPYINNILVVPETMPANKLLSTFIREHRSIAVVVDEFGGTSGIVTTEDILEEIFGEIEDEHDTTDIIEKQISENEFVLSGRSEIDLLNEKYQINLPETEDFETLAGFILFHHESIPKINSLIKIGVFQFKILKATNTKIELVKLTITEV